MALAIVARGFNDAGYSFVSMLMKLGNANPSMPKKPMQRQLRTVRWVVLVRAWSLICQVLVQSPGPANTGNGH